MSDETLYGPTFFAQMGTCREPYRRLADCIQEICPEPPMTVIDLGCGLGFVIERLQELGAEVQGYDLFGSSNIVPIHQVDLTDPLVGFGRADLVICTETAEHLPARDADTLVRHVVESARRAIVWSAAPPGQSADAVGHINEQPPAYWLERFARLGWATDQRRTARLRALMVERHAQHEYCADSFHVLVPT